jgi:hypothetical protein
VNLQQDVAHPDFVAVLQEAARRVRVAAPGRRPIDRQDPLTVDGGAIAAVEVPQPDVGRVDVEQAVQARDGQVLPVAGEAHVAALGPADETLAGPGEGEVLAFELSRGDRQGDCRGHWCILQ